MNSTLFVATLVMALILLSMLVVRQQEASQLLTNASIAHHALACSRCRWWAGRRCVPRCPRG